MGVETVVLGKGMIGIMVIRGERWEYVGVKSSRGIRSDCAVCLPTQTPQSTFVIPSLTRRETSNPSLLSRTPPLEQQTTHFRKQV